MYLRSSAPSMSPSRVLYTFTGYRAQCLGSSITEVLHAAFSDIWFTLHRSLATKHNANPARSPGRSPKFLKSHIEGRRTWLCKIVVHPRIRGSARTPRRGHSSECVQLRWDGHLQLHQGCGGPHLRRGLFRGSTMCLQPRGTCRLLVDTNNRQAEHAADRQFSLVAVQQPVTVVPGSCH